MKQPGRLVFVTFEIYPFTGGGIGRFIYNTLKAMTPDDLARTVVILTSGHVSDNAFESVFKGAQLVHIGEVASPSAARYPLNARDPWLVQSCRVLLALQSIAKEVPIDYVEFVDWSGFAFATLQERLASGFLVGTKMAVRVHSTEAILVIRETRLLQPQDLKRYDLERKCLLDCDVIVAHVRTVAEETRRCFGIPEDRWWNRVHVTPAPIDINERPRAKRSIQPDLNTPIVFTSKFQEIKRPQIFVQAAVGFLRNQPDYRGSILLACGGLDGAYARHIMGLVPDELRPRFRLLPNLSPSQRDDIVSNSIAAFPSTYESFCLGAYEAAYLGGIVLLNGSNPAFGDETPWVDDINCLKFDGGAHDLGTCMQKAIVLSTPLDVVDLPPVNQPWSNSGSVVHTVPAEDGSVPLVTVILVNQNEGLLASDSLDSIARQGYPRLEILYIDDNSQDSASTTLIEHLEAACTGGFSLIRQPTTTGVAAARNWAVARATGDYILFMNAGDLLADGFIEEASSALSKAPDYDVYVTQSRIYDNIDDVTQPEALPVETFAGEAPVSGSVFNYYSDGPRLCRARVASQIRHRPHLGNLCDWGWMHDAVSEGVKVIASPRTDVLVRNRVVADLAEPIDERYRLHHLLVTGSPATERSFPIAALAHVVHGSGGTGAASKLPVWHVHMTENGYEEEVEFVATVLGRTKLGQTIRTNKFVSSVLEQSIRWLSGLK